MAAVLGFAVLTSFWLPAFVDDCADCRPRSVCSAHLERERALLEKLGPDCRETEDGRIALLRKVAAVTREHENAPAPAVIDALGLALDDLSLKVREEALRLLIESQPPQGALPQIVGALEKAQRDIASAPRAEPSAEPPAEGEGGGLPGSTAIAKVEGELRSEIAIQMIPKLAEALARLPDDRSVRALKGFLNWAIHLPSRRALGEPAAQALLALGSRDAILGVIQAIAHVEKKDAALGASLHVRLAAFSESHDLGEPPEWQSGAPLKWRAWYERSLHRLPERLGVRKGLAER